MRNESERKVTVHLLDEAKLAGLRARLINKNAREHSPARAAALRRGLVQAVLAPRKEFLEWFDGKVPESRQDPVKCGIPGKTLSEGEIASPPADTETMWSRVLADLPPLLAARPAFWASYNFALLREGVVEDACHFAKPVGSGAQQTGRGALERALSAMDCAAEDKDAGKGKDGAGEKSVRTLCRQLLGGVPEERGQVSVYIDNRIARAWWRGHILRQTQEDLGGAVDGDAVRDVLRHGGAPWDEMIQHVVRKLTHVGERPIRSALVAALAGMGLSEITSEERVDRTKELFAQTGRRAASRSLGVMSPQEILKVIRDSGAAP